MCAQDKTDKAFHGALDATMRKLNANGCEATVIRCDNKFASSMDKVSDELNVTVDHSDPGKHELTAERNDGVIEEWCRVALHRLPHETSPRILMMALMKETIK